MVTELYRADDYIIIETSNSINFPEDGIFILILDMNITLPEAINLQDADSEGDIFINNPVIALAIDRDGNGEIMYVDDVTISEVIIVMPVTSEPEVIEIVDKTQTALDYYEDKIDKDDKKDKKKPWKHKLKRLLRRMRRRRKNRMKRIHKKNLHHYRHQCESRKYLKSRDILKKGANKAW